MLTRLKVSGFKSLAEAEVRFGPFTCIAGTNGSGKSNLFDAVLFLRDLADHTIIEAAHRVRDRSGSKRTDLRALFTRTHKGPVPNIVLEADLIVPDEVVDDFGRKTKPSTTYLTYRVELKHVGDESNERIELVSEELTYLSKRTARRRVGFPTAKEFAGTAFVGERRAPYITTEQLPEGASVIKISQDGNQGRPSQVPPQHSPRTILGSANTDERPTVLAARREIQSWKLLQLEPSRLRASDEFSDDPHITWDGAHVPSTLERIKRFEEISNRVSALLPEVRSVSVDVDNVRRLKTLVLEQRNGLVHKARALSDGTLRFLALAALAFDPEAKGVVCLEEPENGIHPSRISAILELLRDMAVDAQSAVSDDNPLRQVIVNTHSPVVVRKLTPDELLVALPVRKGKTSFTAYGAMIGSWRLKQEDRDVELTPSVTLAELLDYLHNTDSSADDPEERDTLWQLAARQSQFEFMTESVEGDA